MRKVTLFSQLLATTVFCGAFGVAPAMAQEADQVRPEAQTGPIEGAQGTEEADTSGSVSEGQPASEIVVTGTRIPQPNLTSASPVTVIGSQEVRLQGTTRTEDLINSLPQSFAAQGSNIANGASGTATVNLRGLGSSRTLVLVNGRRLMPGDPLLPVADINFIPALAIQRVDVLTGGASSVYGADAVSGVVNFIMDTNFEGIRLDGQYSFFHHNNDGISDIREAITARGFALPSGHRVDGQTVDLAAMFGTSFDDGRGHVTAYATYRDQRAVMQGDRDYSACAVSALSETQADAAGRLFNCGGSGTSYPGTFLVLGDQGGQYTVGPNGTFIQPTPLYNYAPANHFQRPDERYTFGVFASYEINETFEPYLEAMFMDDRTVAQIAPGGNFFNTSSVNCDNPLLSDQQRGIICDPSNVFVGPAGEDRGNVFIARRNVEGGPRQDDLQHTSFRVVAGLRGDFARGLSYDAYYQFGRTNFAENYYNELSGTRLARALDVVTDPTTGQPVCRTALTGEDPACVPYNVFTLDQVTPEALDYLSAVGFQRGMTEQRVANASVTALLGEYGMQSPWATSGFAINVGVEYRKESLEHTTDEAFSSGDLTGQGGPRLSAGQGELDVTEFFGEIQLPIANDRPFMDLLELRAGYRRSQYEVGDGGFETDTYKIEGEWAPIRDIRFRGSYNRAVRAPNILELFGPQAVGLGDYIDLCAGPAVNGLVNGLTAAECARTGVTAAQFGNILVNPADQYNIFYGGNPNLQPEVADSYTAGVVLQPSFLPNLAVTVDYFQIDLRNAISTVPESTSFAQCVATGDPFFCGNINRDDLGTLWLTPEGFITATNTNVGGVSTRGIDVNASYAHDIGNLGGLNFSFVGTYLLELTSNPLADIEFDCAGFFLGQCGTPNPEWRHKLRVTWTMPNGVGLSAQWRHFSAVDNAGLSSDPDLAQATVAPGNRHFPSQDYLDLVMTARIGDNFSWRIGANNVLDRDPPIAVTSPPSGSGNTYPQVYDALGRYIFTGVTLTF